MKRLIAAVGTLALSLSAWAGPADQPQKPQQVSSEPVQMTDTQLDSVVAGDLIRLDVSNVANNNQVQVAVPLNAAVAANVLTVGSQAAAGATQPGRIGQRR